MKTDLPGDNDPKAIWSPTRPWDDVEFTEELQFIFEETDPEWRVKRVNLTVIELETSHGTFTVEVRKKS